MRVSIVRVATLILARRFQFVASFVALIAATLPASAQEPYRAPDGTNFERSFDYSGNLFDPEVSITVHNVLLVCSDKPDYYLPRLRRFVEYALADQDFTILDGRTADADLNLDEVTMVFFGRPAETPFDHGCTNRYTGFGDFVEENRQRLLQEKGPGEITLPGGRVLPLGDPVCGGGLWKLVNARNSHKRKKIQASFSARFTSSEICLASNFLNLFRFSTRQCEPAARCADLWRYVNSIASKKLDSKRNTAND